ncbi:MAG: ribbon-helix-helix domain-containing protein [archaeon]
MAVVPIRLSREQIRRINLLVKLGMYSNRSEAIRSMLEHSMDLEIQRYLSSPKVERTVKAMLAYKGSQRPLTLATRKTAADLIAESRR